MRAVELFCGIGGFRLACDSLGIRTVWANDLSMEACSIYRNTFGSSSLVEGDIREHQHQIPNHDLLTAGFPCQPFSSAGKKQGVRDPRGTLFSVIADVIERKMPEVFVLENVKRLLSMESGEHFGTILDVFSHLPYALEWRLLNAMDFGLPQNRQRVFITGRRLATGSTPTIALASEADLIASCDDHALLGAPERWQRIEQHGRKFQSWGMAWKGRFYGCDMDVFSSAQETAQLTDLMELDPASDFFMDASTAERIESSVHVNKLVQGVRVLYNQAGGARMGYTVFGTDGVVPTLTASHSRHYERYLVNGRYRRLTNVEYARLQGFPDDHCGSASVFNQYGLFGNAVPPPMAAWVVRQMTSSNTGLRASEIKPRHETQLALAL